MLLSTVTLHFKSSVPPPPSCRGVLENEAQDSFFLMSMFITYYKHINMSHYCCTTGLIIYTIYTYMENMCIAHYLALGKESQPVHNTQHNIHCVCTYILMYICVIIQAQQGKWSPSRQSTNFKEKSPSGI